MPHIVDWHVVVLTPKERHRFEALMRAQHVLRSCLTLALRHNPMLYAELLARVRIGPACHVPGGKDSRSTGFQILIHHNSAVDPQACLCCQVDRWPHSDSQNNKISFDGCPSAQCHLASVDTL